jgi:purine-binding chemotaxis protein CheW
MYDRKTGVSNGDDKIQVLTVRVADREYALDLASVVQVVRLVSPKQAIPPDVVEGMFNLRGRNIPVVNTWQKCGLARTADLNVPLVITRANGNFVAFAVDAVSDVLTLPSANLEPVPSNGMPVRAIGHVENRTLFLLDPEKL